jgi:PLP dependent protein
MNSIDRLNDIRSRVPANVKIVAVSKTKPASMIEELYMKAGHRIFGENRVQELESKHSALPADIDWHLIGHLQTNKIKYITPYVGLIQSVDSYKLLLEINKEAVKCNRVIPCLLQFHIAREETKYGFSLEEVLRMLNDKSFSELTNVSIKGVMGIATFTTDNQQIISEFRTLSKIYKRLKSEYFINNPDFCEVSMGMTDDYQFALDEGSTIIRIGSGIFGHR